MDNMQKLEEELNRIKERNKRVEVDKEWEMSRTRRLLILVLTYLVIVTFFLVAKLPKPWLNAIVPATGFILSTLTIGWIKNI